MSSHNYTSLEDLLLATLEAGPLLTKAKGPAASWRVGRLAASRGPGTEDVIERGGIVQTLRGGTPKSAMVADLPDSNLGRDLAEAEAEIADTKQAYYDALSRRNRALRALAREGGDE